MLDMSTLLLFLAFLFCVTGFGLLALVQERHFGHFYLSFKPVAQQIRAQEAIGIIAIFISLPMCIAAQGNGFGSLIWVLLVTASAMTVALLLTWMPGAFKPLAWLCKRLFQNLFAQHLTR